MGVIADVFDCTARDSAVGNNDATVIRCIQNSGEKIDLVYFADHTCSADNIADFEGPENHQQDARSKIAERSLKGQTDCKTHRGQNCCHAAHLDTDLVHHQCRYDAHDGIENNLVDELAECFVDLSGHGSTDRTRKILGDHVAQEHHA